MNIHKITSDFNFDGIDLEEPKSLQGGSAYSVPIRYNNEVLSFQTQQCKCKNGFVANVGLSGITPSTHSGLTASTTYYFKIAVDGGSAYEVAFTTDASVS